MVTCSAPESLRLSSLLLRLDSVNLSLRKEVELNFRTQFTYRGSLRQHVFFLFDHVAGLTGDVIGRLQGEGVHPSSLKLFQNTGARLPKAKACSHSD